MTDATIFDSTTQENQASDTTQPTGFQIPTEAVDFIGSGKKYQTPEEALKSVPHAQKHIQTLEAELQTLKEELTKRKTAADILDELKSGLPQETTIPNVEIDPDKISQIVEQSLTIKEQQRIAKQNTETVASKFTEKYGEKAEEVYQTIAKEAGLSVGQLNQLAASAPSAVLKLAGFDRVTNSVPTKPSSSVNTQAFTGTQPTTNLSAKVPKGATTRDLVNAWKAAGEKVKQNLSST